MPISNKHTSCKARISLQLIILLAFLFDAVCATSKRCPEISECIDQGHCGKMAHKCQSDSIFPLQYIGIFVLALLMSLVTSAGLGGGEIVVPVIKIFFGFSQSQASPISTSCIMMAGIVRFIINYNKRESIKYNKDCITCARLSRSSGAKPDENTPTCSVHRYSNRERVPIRYNICMILLPAIFLGLTLGHSLHQILPEIIQEVMLLMVLAFCMYESIHKGMENWRKETEHLKEAHQPILSVKEFSDDPKFNENKEINREDLFTAGEFIREATLQNYEESTKDHNHEQAVQEFFESEKSHWQFRKLLPIWAIFGALVLQSFLKDSGMVTIQSCSMGYWTVYTGYGICCMAALIYSYLEFKKEIRKKQELFGSQLHDRTSKHSQPSGPTEIYTNTEILTITCMSIGVGAISAVIGIGGGLLFIPILLRLGYPPFVASSTSMFMVMYAAAGNSISYFISGELNVKYALWLGLWTCIGVIFGVTVSNKVVRRTGRPSILIIILAFVLVLCIIFTTIFGVKEITETLNDGEDIFELGHMCG